MVENTSNLDKTTAEHNHNNYVSHKWWLDLRHESIQIWYFFHPKNLHDFETAHWKYLEVGAYKNGARNKLLGAKIYLLNSATRSKHFLMQIKADEQRSKKRKRRSSSKKRILKPRLSFSWLLRSHTCTYSEQIPGGVYSEGKLILVSHFPKKV